MSKCEKFGMHLGLNLISTAVEFVFNFFPKGKFARRILDSDFQQTTHCPHLYDYIVPGTSSIYIIFTFSLIKHSL